MRLVISYQLLVISYQLSVIGFLVAFVGAAEPLPLSKSYWQDEVFLKSFNGSYRINARIEPAVGTAERGLLVSVQSLMAEGKRKEALARLKASPLVKTSAAVAFNAGNISFELGDLEAAEGFYRDALKKFPNFLRAHRNLGFVHAREDEWDQSMAALTEAVRLGDQDGATLGQLGYGRMQKGEYASALQAFRLAQLTQPMSIDWKAGVAQCLQHLKRNEEALVLLDEVIRARPAEASYYLLQASVYLLQDRVDDAIANLDLVRRMGKLGADDHLLLGNLHLRAGSVRLARPVLMASLKIEQKPTAGAALNALEFVTEMREWEFAGDFAEALGEALGDGLGKKLESKRRRLGALIGIESGEGVEEGMKVLVQLVKEDPLDGAALVLLGKYRAGEKRHEEAEMFIRQAQQVEQYDYRASVELAKLYVSTARYADAVKQLDRALGLRHSQELVDYREAVEGLAEASR